MSLPTTKVKEWTRDGFMISTDPSLVDLEAVNTAFASDQLPWAKALSHEELAVMLDRSICFALYSLTAASTAVDPDPSLKPAMIGLARLITDCTTMAYLTDVYILPEWQGRGLGTWLIGCVKEWWDLMPNGRRLILITGEGKKESFYANHLLSGRMEDEGVGHRIFAAKGKGALI